MTVCGTNFVTINWRPVFNTRWQHLPLWIVIETDT